jgi:chromosome segregation ATPase
MGRPFTLTQRWRLFAVAGCFLIAGCRMAPREQLEDCHRLSQTLRSENARLKDQTLALKSQNRDLSERAVDDARQLSRLEETNRGLESSVQAYQDERSRLESAYRELQANLPASLKPLSLDLRDEDTPETVPKTTNPRADSKPRQSRIRPRSDERSRFREGWAPSRSDD